MVKGPAKILDIDETGVTANFQSQTFKVARYCVRKEEGEKDLDDEELDPTHEEQDCGGGARNEIWETRRMPMRRKGTGAQYSYPPHPVPQ